MSATFSECGQYRYSLTRDIGALGAEGTVTFVGLNPSTADATTDDPTIRRCIRFARDWGYDRLKMMNLYAYRATDPKRMLVAADPVGPENDHHLSVAFGGSDLIVAAWGVNAGGARLVDFYDTFSGWQFHCLGTTKHGDPRHPLYVLASQQPVLFAPFSLVGRAGEDAA